MHTAQLPKTDSVHLDTDHLAQLRAAVDAALDQACQPEPGAPERLTAAIRYSLLAPGKRLRPILTLLAAEAVGGQWRSALPAACAVEMIHAYSLIHDDLPAMDNDDLRRGKPTCHKQFDQATAILAGDALQALAFEVLASAALNKEALGKEALGKEALGKEALGKEAALVSCLELARAAGRTALVGGQQDDLAAEGRFGFTPYGLANVEQLEFLKRIHQRKTGAMITVSVKLGGIAGGASPPQLAALELFGSKIGLAFQIVDDLLDVESSAETMGKHTGKDEAAGKLTYPGLMGAQPSRTWAEQLIGEACTALAPLGPAAGPLVAMARFVLERNN